MNSRLALSFSLVALLASSACGPKHARIAIGRMPENGTFHGVWQSPQYGRMHLCDSNGTVIGEYTQDERLGTIRGRVSGDVLRFEWEERREMVVGRPTLKKGHGYFRLVVGEDGHQYVRGEWGDGDDEIGGGVWNAVKLPRDRPTDCYAHVRETGGRSQDSASDDDVRFSDEVESSPDSTPESSTPDAPAGN